MLSFNQPAFSQQARLKGEIALERGTVRQIVRDSVGFMWFASSDGLYRYDGTWTRTYAPGLPGCGALKHSFFACALPLSGGDLLLGSRGQGLLRYVAHLDSIVQVVPQFEDVELFTDGVLNAILPLGDDRYILSFSLTKAGLVIYDAKLQIAERLTDAPSRSATYVLKQDLRDPRHIWLAEDKLKRLDLATNTLVEFPGPFDLDGTLVGVLPCAFAMEWADSTTLLVGGRSGLAAYDVKTNKWETIPEVTLQVLALAKMEDGQVLVGSNNMAMYGGGKLTPVYDNEEVKTSIYLEGSTLWVSGFNSDVEILDLADYPLVSEHIEQFETGKRQMRNLMQEVAVGENLYYAGMGSVPLWFRSRGSDSPPLPLHIPGAEHLDAYSMVADSKGEKMYLATFQGVWAYEVAGNSMKPVEGTFGIMANVKRTGRGEYLGIGRHQVFVFNEDGQTRHLGSTHTLAQNASTFQGVSYLLADNEFYKIEGDTLVEITKPFSQGTAMLADDSGLWINGDQTLFHFDGVDWERKPFARDARLRMREFREDCQGRIWALSDAGLAYFDKETRHLQLLTEEHGLHQKAIFDFSLFRNAHDTCLLYLGAIQYLVTIDPSLFGNKIQPAPIFSGIEVMGEPVRQASHSSGGDTLHLQWMENYIRFKFSTPHFNFGESYAYSYTLEGYEDMWHYTDDLPEAYYTRLPPGNYRLVVRAPGSDGAMALEKWVVIYPPFWLTWWFRISIGAILLVAGIAAYRLRIAKIRREEALKRTYLEEVNRMEIKALRAQMNPHFIFNSLNSIRSCIMEGNEEAAVEYIGKFAKLMRTILDQSRGQSNLIRDEIEMLRLYVDLEKLRLGRAVEFRIEADPALNQDTTYLPAMTVQPFVENALWHGLLKEVKAPRLTVHFALCSKGLVAVIEDNGVGRGAVSTNDNPLRKSHATAMVSERLEVERRSGREVAIEIEDLKATDGSAAGTRVTLTFGA